jgi:hypothetical protein
VINRFEIWRQRPWAWLVPLVVLALNLAVFGFYRVAYAGRVEDLQARAGSESAELARLERDRQRLEALRQRIGVNREGMGELREDWFSIEAERLTRTIARLKELVRDAGLSPQSYNYPSSRIEGQDLVRRDFVFQVEGSYEQIRRFINFLELTEDFLILEEVTLDESRGTAGNPRLRVRFLISTVFVDPSGRRVS